MRGLLLTMGVLAALLSVACPVSAEKITSQHRDYPVLQLVQSKREALTQLDESCRQAEQVREATQLVSDLSRPLLPALDAIAESKVLKAMAKIPGVGAPIEVIQGTAAGLRELLRLLAWVNEIDQQYEAPIRDAILKSNRLLKSQDSRDVPPLLDSYEAACLACTKIETRLEAAQTGLRKTIKLAKLSLDVLDRVGDRAAKTGKSTRELVDQLEELQTGVDLLSRQVRDGHAFMQQVLTAAGRNPVATAPDTAKVRKPAKGTSGARQGSTAPAATTSAGPAPPTADGSAGRALPTGVAGSASSPAPAAMVPASEPELNASAASHGPSAAHPATRKGNSPLVLLLSALPGVAALLAIAWMTYNHYVLAPQRREAQVPPPPVAAPARGMAALRLGGRYMLIPSDQPVFIGSSAARAFIYIDDPSVAPVHARIENVNGSWWITDLGSQAQTLVDGQPVTQAVLVDGQRLRLGQVEMKFTIPSGH